MATKAFFSFHYKPDAWRTSQVRNIGALDGNKSINDNDWEDVTKGGDTAIQKWIDGQMSGRNCSILLIGANTAGRKWINYEIEQAWKKKMGMLGIYVHNLLDSSSKTSSKGKNPYDGYVVGDDKKPMTNWAKTYDPTGTDSKAVYSYIADHIEGWVETAIKARS